MIASVIVLYQPDVARLRMALERITGQVERVLVIDNSPDGGTGELAEAMQAQPGSVQYVKLGRNLGLAAAQNLGIAECVRGGCTHILFLDQDSMPPLDLVGRLVEAEQALQKEGARVAAVGPLFIDRKSRQVSYAIRYGWFHAQKIRIDPLGSAPVEADWVISSGSLIRSAVLEEIGGMREDLFIDWVDAEWGLRARMAGYRSYVVPSAVMDHSIGDSSEKLLKYRFNLHSVARNYYIVRNAVYLLQPKTMGWKWVTAMLLRIPKHIAVHSWYSSDRWQSFKTMMRATVDGFRGRLGPMAE